MCRKVELLDKRMMLGVVVTQIVPQMMQFQQLHQHQIEVDSLSSGNLSSIQPALRHLIDFITVQHQVGCESVMLVKKDVLILNGQKLVQGMQVHKKLIDFNTKAPRKRLSPAYKTSVNRAYEYRKEGKRLWEQLSPEERKIRSRRLKELERAEKSMTPTVPLDANYKRIQYTRYADDFLIGVIGSKEDAEHVKRDVKAFLQDALKLEMSDTKTKVTHTGDRARFLGYDITVSRSQNMKKLANGKIQRCQTGVVKLLVPREKWVGKLLEYQAIKIKINENGKERFVALHRGKLVNKSDIEILATYNAEVRGLYNYYSIANDSFKIGRFGNVMKYSMYKTFACKYKTNVHEIKRRYCVGDLFTVAYDTKAGRKTTTFYRDGYKRKEKATKFDNVSELPDYSKYTKTNTLKQRVERHGTTLWKSAKTRWVISCALPMHWQVSKERCRRWSADWKPWNSS